MTREEELTREIEFLRKLVLSQSTTIDKLIAERAAAPVVPWWVWMLRQPAPTVPQPPQIIPLPGIAPPYDPIPPMYPWEPYWQIPPDGSICKNALVVGEPCNGVHLTSSSLSIQ